jgi:CDP-diglyceride synthetase
MGCLLALLAAISPRLALVLVWIFTNLVDRAFTGFLLPLLGLIFLPFTTLLYVLAYQPVVGVTGWGWVLVFLGLLFDLGSYGQGAFGRRR